MKTLAFIRTHFIDSSVVSEYSKLKKSCSENLDTVLFIDNHKKFIDIQRGDSPLKTIIFNEKELNCFIFDEEIYKESKLPYYTDNPNNRDIGKIMWYCSDYPFYIVQKYFPKYDYYWQIESDVFCNGNSYDPFFHKYFNNNSDLIIRDFRSFCNTNENWFWNDKTDWIYKDSNKYGGFFPVVRLSNKASKFLYQRRLEHAKIFKLEKNYSDNKWLFCESFVPTELANNGYKCETLPEEKIRYMPVYNLNKERIFEEPDFRLYHPVK